MSGKYLTITALTRYIKEKFNRDPYLTRVAIVGEVTNFRKRATHQYFSLKDEHAKISAVCFKSHYDKIGIDLHDGMKIVAFGRVSVFESSGEYQIYIEDMFVDGQGNLIQELNKLRERLSQEGLFAKEKKSIPYFPKTIAVVTSQSGSVIHDIKTTILRRFPIVDIHIYPTVVQGKESAASIVTNLSKIEQSKYTYDTVIIARGGGSLEDLWSFNDETVVRKVADFPLPIISAVGHETDTTLTDLAADLRAPTPTAAAEQATPVLMDIINFLNGQQTRLFNGIKKQVTFNNERLQKVQNSYIFTQSERLYDSYIQKLDYQLEQLNIKMQQLLIDATRKLEQVNYRLEKNQPGIKIERLMDRLLRDDVALKNAMQYVWRDHNQQFERQLNKLDSLSPLNTMKRGYAHVTNGDKTVTAINDVKESDTVKIALTDGQITAQVTHIDKKEL